MALQPTVFNPAFNIHRSTFTPKDPTVKLKAAARYLEIRTVFEVQRQSLTPLQHWVWSHRWESNLLGVIAKLVAWIFRLGSRLNTLDQLQLHLACYQHLAQIQTPTPGIGIPRFPLSRTLPDPLLAAPWDWQQAVEDVCQNGMALKDLPIKFRSDREIVLLAVEKNGMALEYACEKLRFDPEIVQVAIAQNAGASRWAFKSQSWVDTWHLVSTNGVDFAMLPLALRSDKEMVMAAVQQSGMRLQYAGDSLKADKAIALLAIQHGCILQVIDPSLHDDKDVVLAVVQRHGEFVLPHLSKTMLNDKDISIAAIQCSGGYALYRMTKAMRRNKEVVLAAVKKNGAALMHASEELKSDKEVALLAVQQDAKALAYVGPKLKDDADILFAATQPHEVSTLIPNFEQLSPC